MIFVMYDNWKSDSLRTSITFISAFVIMGSIFSLRSADFAADTRVYCNFFNDLANVKSLSSMYNTEMYEKAFGFCIFFKGIASICGGENYVYLITTGVFVIGIILIALYKFGLDSRPAIIYFFLLCFLPWMNVTRTAMSISLLFLGFVLFYQKKYLWSYFNFFLAVSFHKIAAFPVILIILSYFVNKRNFTKLLLICGIAVLSADSIISLFSNLFTVYDGYLENVDDEVKGKNIFYQIVFISTFIYAKWISKNVNEKKLPNFFFPLLFICGIEIIIGILGFQSWFLIRLNMFFQALVSLLIIFVLYYENRYTNLYKISSFSILFFGFSWYLAFKTHGGYSTWLN